MAEFIVRIWVDLKVQAETEAEAKRKADKTVLHLVPTEHVEKYDEQTAQVWPYEKT